MDPRAIAIVTFVVLEAAILLARRFAAPLRPGLAFQVWAAVLALYVGLESPELLATEPTWWRVLCTLLLMLSVLVVYEVLDAFLLGQPARRHRGPRLPKLPRDFVRVVLVLISGIVSAYYIYEIPLPTVLVSSTVLSAVLALALQDVLKNVFAGMAVQLEGHIKVGDWLLVDEQTVVVRDVSWRTTHLRTNEGVDIFEPNAQFAARRLVHYRAGEPPVAFGFRIGLPYETPPAVAKRALLAAAASTASALKDPPPIAMLHGYGDSAIDYELRVWTHDVNRIARFRDQVNSRIWYEIQRAGLSVPFPIRTVHLRPAEQPATDGRDIEIERRAALLARSELFSRLAPETLLQLAASSQRLHFEDGERLMEEGDPDHRVLVIDRGDVSISSARQAEGASEVGSGEVQLFGELSLFTGEPQAATVTARREVEALILTKDDLQAILGADPAIAERLGQCLAERLTAATGGSSRGADRQRITRREQTTLVRRIRAFYGLR